MLLGEIAPALRLLAPGQPTEPVQLVERVVGTLAVQGLQDDRVVGDVVADERRNLIGDGVWGS